MTLLPQFANAPSNYYKGATYAYDHEIFERIDAVGDDVTNGLGNPVNFVSPEAQLRVKVAANALRLAAMIFQGMAESVMEECADSLVVRIKEMKASYLPYLINSSKVIASTRTAFFRNNPTVSSFQTMPRLDRFRGCRGPSSTRATQSRTRRTPAT